MNPQVDNGRVFVRAPAKINLCLHVGAKRPDGFHELESLVAFTRLGDEILVEREDELQLSIGGPFAERLSSGDDNLVMKAARALHVRSGIGARISLLKKIPLASGVGGGSADAAATLRALVRLWSLPISSDDLHTIAAQLGSDVPVCIESSPAWMTGRGEVVQLLPRLPEISIVLVNPKVEVPTADVFRRLDKRRGTGLPAPMTAFSDADSLVQFLAGTTNDLQSPAIEIAPVIGRVIAEVDRLPGALMVRMSGSGATCFGLFESGETAKASADLLRERHPDWWIVDTSVAPRELSLASAA
jgi:4-diphosphocytidyl-2-C-methyl-D-erythritol kinase